MRQIIEITAERVAKLPEWARRERERNQRQIRELEAEVAALRNEPSALDQNVWNLHVAELNPYGNRVPIGDGHVRYAVGDHQWLDVRYKPDRFYGPNLEVSSDRSLRIAPQSGNVVKIFRTDR